MVLVVGATGIVGGMVTRRLLDQGKRVRILVRRDSPSLRLAAHGMATSAQALIDAGAEAVYGDLTARASLDSAVNGMTTVVSTANSALRSERDNVETVDLQGNKNLIEAARAAGVEHFIFVSALGVSTDSPVPFLQAKAITEKRLRTSGMDWTIIAPAAFMESWPAVIVGLPVSQGHPVTLVGKGDHRHSFISNQDVAAFTAACVENPSARNRYLPVGGPEALSYTEVVRVYERVTGQTIPVTYVEPAEPIPHISVSTRMMLLAQEGSETVVDCSALAEHFEVEQTSMEEFVRQTAQKIPGAR